MIRSPKTTIAAILALLIPLMTSAETVQIQTFQRHSRLSFRMDEGVAPVWKEIPGGFELFLKGMALTDLGAPLGEEQGWIQEQERQILKARDPRLASLKFQESAAGLKVVGLWKFPKGDQAPAHPKMDRFDYRQKNPPQYVIDFWPRQGPTVAELKEANKVAHRKESLKKSEEDAKKRRDRRLAAEKVKAESEDVNRFCRLPLSESTDVFLPFKPVHDPIKINKWLATNSADANYDYLEPKGDSREAQYVRLALNLYRQGKHALAIKTLDFFEAEFPHSDFRNEHKFLRANAMYKLGIEVEPARILRELMVDAKGTPVALYSGMFNAARSYEKGEYSVALDGFLWLINHYPDHRLIWVFHLAAAESFYALSQMDQAAKEYQWVAENAPDENYRADAAMRIGNIQLGRNQHESSLATYFQALSRFKDVAKNFPSAHINRAESLYWLAEYDRAEEAYQKFLEEFPTHPSGWRAAMRLGEIQGRRNKLEEASKWYYATINRFPYSAGATLARTRLLPCGDHGGFDFQAAERFYSTEALAFDGKGEVGMELYPDFRALYHVRALTALEADDRAIDVAIYELNAPHKVQGRLLISEMLRKLFRRAILTRLAQGKKYEALTFYDKLVGSIPKAGLNSDFVDPDYLLKLSQAASDLGLGTLAHRLADAHGVAADEEKKRGARSLASDAQPGADDLVAKLKVSEQRFTEAKAMWISQGTEASPKIRELLGQVIPESEYSYEREIILGLIDEKDQKHASALAHAVRAQLLKPSKATADDANRLEYWVASLHALAGESKSALELYRKLESVGAAKAPAEDSKDSSKDTKEAKRALASLGTAAALGLSAVPGADQLILTQGEILTKQGKWGEASATYARAVEGGLGGNQALYEYARALRKQEDPQSQAKGLATLKKLASSETDDFWRKLAREAIAVKGAGDE